MQIADPPTIERRPVARRRPWRWVAIGTGCLLAASLALAIPQIRAMLPWERNRESAPLTSDGHEDHDEHDHDHGFLEHSPTEDHEHNSLELSPQARENIGLKVAQIELQPFERTVEIPGIVIEQPGRSTVEITAPMTGVVQRIYPILGEAVQPGAKLFEIRLTHEELVQAQSEFLRTAEELDVIGQEVERLQKIAKDGAIAGKTLLDRQYEQQKEAAVQRAQHQALLLHGLSEEQVQTILKTRRLLQDQTVTVPSDEPQDESSQELREIRYQVQELRVEKGQHVSAGDTLAVLTNHDQLLIEGNAFEKDSLMLNQAAEAGWNVSAVMNVEGKQPEVIRDLSILYLSGTVSPQSRAFHFYVTLPNELLRETEARNGHRFVYWRFKPGQRVQLQIPVQRETDKIVVPVDAIAQDGIENYVFISHGDHFDRRPVRIEHRDTVSVVIANDGSLTPGESVAISGAQQLQLALKNQSGGGLDPHAGHHH